VTGIPLTGYTIFLSNITGIYPINVTADATQFILVNLTIGEFSSKFRVIFDEKSRKFGLTYNSSYVQNANVCKQFDWKQRLHQDLLFVHHFGNRLGFDSYPRLLFYDVCGHDCFQFDGWSSSYINNYLSSSVSHLFSFSTIFWNFFTLYTSFSKIISFKSLNKSENSE
jgi:hypothetical protein